MDLIFTASAQSTLGWCLGSGREVVLVELAGTPTRVSGLAATVSGRETIRELKVLSPSDPLMAPRDLGAVLRHLFRAPGGERD